MGEDRRLKIAKRQKMLAQIAQREARFALAGALAEEDRSGQISERARTLLHEYERRIVGAPSDSHSQTLQSNLAFVRTLQTMVENAQEAHNDTRDQTHWQMQTLARAEARLSAHKTRTSEEQRALDNLRARRDVPQELTGGSMRRGRHS